MCPYTTRGVTGLLWKEEHQRGHKEPVPSAASEALLYIQGETSPALLLAATHPFPSPRPKCCACGWTSGTSSDGPRPDPASPFSPGTGDNGWWERATKEQGLTVAVVVTERQRPSQTHGDGADRGGPVRWGERGTVEEEWFENCLHGERYRDNSLWLEAGEEKGRQTKRAPHSTRPKRLEGQCGREGGGQQTPPLPLGDTPKHLPSGGR